MFQCNKVPCELFNLSDTKFFLRDHYSKLKPNLILGVIVYSINNLIKC